MNRNICWRALLILFDYTVSLTFADSQNFHISIDIVTSRRGNDCLHGTEHISPKDDIHVTLYLSCSAINPQEPFLSVRRVFRVYLITTTPCLQVHDAAEHRVDLRILNVEWGNIHFLKTALDLQNSRYVWLYSGMVGELVKENSLPKLCCALSVDYIIKHTKWSVPLTRQPTVFSDLGVFGEDYVKATVMLLGYLNWRHVVLVTDNKTVSYINHVLGMVTEGRHKFYQFMILDDTPPDNIKTILGNLYRRSRNGKLNFLVFCEIHCVTKILLEAQQFDTFMSGKKALSFMSQWIVMVLPQHREMIENLLTDLNNIVIVIASSEGQSGDDIEELRKVMGEAVMEVFASPNLTVSYSDGDDIKEMIVNTTINMLGRRHTWPEWCWWCAGDVVEILTALWTPSGRKFNPVGHFSLQDGLHIDPGGIFPNLKFGFNNRKLRIATLPWPLFVNINKDTHEYEGLCIDLLEELSRRMNFSYILYEPEDGEWGVKKPDGHWSGLVGELEFRKADLTVAPLGVTADREKVADFTFQFYYEYSSVLIKKPDVNIPKWRKLIDIFTYPVYLTVLFSLPIMTVILCLSERYNPYNLEYWRERHRSPFPGLFQLQGALICLYRALVGQAGMYLPRSQSGRTLLSFWWLYCIILVTTYRGNLVAFLTVSIDRLPFNTLKEMADQEDYKWGTIGGAFLSGLIQTSASQRIWRGIEKFSSEIDALSKNHSKHIDMVKQGGYAYIVEKSGMVKFMAEDCNLVYIKEDFYPVAYGIGLPNDSPYSTVISHQVQKIVESGLMNVWKQKWWPHGLACRGSQIMEADSVQLADVQSAFYVLFIGWLLGILTVLVETAKKKGSRFPGIEVQQKLKTENKPTASCCG